MSKPIWMTGVYVESAEKIKERKEWQKEMVAKIEGRGDKVLSIGDCVITFELKENADEH